jgi:ketosteroid isomerase-like protein
LSAGIAIPVILAAMSRERARRGDHGRAFDERVALAMPAPVVRFVLSRTVRLPAGSPARRRGVKRLVELCLDGTNRDDLDFCLLFYEPDVELYAADAAARALGLAARYEGHKGVRALVRDYKEDMDELRFEAQGVHDLGDRIAVRATVIARGRRSGATTTGTRGLVYYLSPRGMIARQELYWDWEEAQAALEQRG